MWVRLIFSNCSYERLFAIEELQDHDAGDVLLQVRVDLGDGDTNAPVALAHAFAEQRGGVEDDAAARRT